MLKRFLGSKLINRQKGGGKIMEANRQVKLMQQDNSEKLKALAKIMLVSMLWRGAGLLESDKAGETPENTDREKEQNTDTENDASQCRN